MQDLSGNFNMTLEWLVERHDPKIICHPAVVIFADLLWTRLAQWLGSATGPCLWKLLSSLKYCVVALSGTTSSSVDATSSSHCVLPGMHTVHTPAGSSCSEPLCCSASCQVFIAGQAILGRTDGSFEERIGTFCCRIFIYLGSMCRLLYSSSAWCRIVLRVDKASDRRNSKSTHGLCLAVVAASGPCLCVQPQYGGSQLQVELMCTHVLTSRWFRAQLGQARISRVCFFPRLRAGSTVVGAGAGARRQTLLLCQKRRST